MTTTEQELRVRVAGEAGYLELNRPRKANAYTTGMLEALAAGLGELAGRPQVRAVVVCSSSEGRFCGGADLDEIGARGAADAQRIRSLEVFDLLDACPLPTIAAVDGGAVAGGLELALACDLRLASDRAFFALPETALGILPAAGALYRLPRAAGDAVARRMILFGERLDAAAALACGLAAEVVPAGQLSACVDRWVAAAARGRPLATRLAKEALALVRSEQGCRPFIRSSQALLYPGSPVKDARRREDP